MFEAQQQDKERWLIWTIVATFYVEEHPELCNLSSRDAGTEVYASKLFNVAG
jgi:hypothetical protein